MRRFSPFAAALWAVGIAALAAFPWLTNNYFIHIASLIGVFTIVAVGMNILVGMTGLVSLGHAGLFAVGAYTSALLGTRLEVSFWLSAVAAIVVTGAVGSVLALAALRARGIYLAMVTIAFGIIVEQVALDQDEFTGGFMGISGIPYPSIGDFTFSAPYRLYLIVVLAGLCLWLSGNLQRSRWGRGLLAVRESWVAAESLGVSRYRMETMAFALSAALAGLGGALFAAQNAFIAPSIFAFDLSILMLLFVILGGLGTVWGPAIGTAVLVLLPEFIAGFTHVRLVIYGAVMLACLYFMPQGIAGFFEGRRRERMRAQYRLPPPDIEGLKESIARRQMPGRSGALVEIAGLSKVFGGLVALDDLTMEIRPGAIHSVIGPNGAGKTTLVNVLSGFYRPEGGEVRFAGDRVTGWPAHRLATRGVARTFQATRLFPQLTVLANVMVGLHQHMDYGLAPALLSTPGSRGEERRAEAQALAALEIVGFHGDPLVSAGNLAFGHQRLVEIARALVTHPVLLLLDEPAAGLSSSEIETLDKLIVRIRDLGVTVLLIEHHMDLVMEISEWVTVLDYGRKIAEGPPDVVQADPQVVEAYLGHDD